MLVSQWYLTLWDPRNCGPSGFSVHGISQARILKRVATASSRGSSPPRDQVHVISVSYFNRWVLYHRHHLRSPAIIAQGARWSEVTEILGFFVAAISLACLIYSLVGLVLQLGCEIKLGPKEPCLGHEPQRARKARLPRAAKD